MRGRVGVVEVREDAAASDEEVPRLDAVRQIRLSPKSRLIVSDDLAQRVVGADGVRRRGVVKVEDRHGRMRIVDLPGAVRDVLRDQVPLRQRAFDRDDEIGDVALEPVGHDVVEGVGLVDELEVEIVEAIDLRHDLADVRVHEGHDGRIEPAEVVRGLAREAGAKAVHVVPRVQRRELPHRVLVEGTEQDDLDHDTAPLGLGEVVPEPREERVVPP